MSQAGRYAHQQNQKRHAQRTVNQPRRAPIETIESATWLTDTMEQCRELAASLGNEWSIGDLAAIQQVSLEEAERRLRKLSGLGFLKMTAAWAAGKFNGFRFGMVNVNLPR